MSAEPGLLEHLPADVHGLLPFELAALAGKLAAHGVVLGLNELRPPVDPFLPAEREQLAQELEAAATLHAPHVAVLDSIRSLARPGASCVVTCLEPGLGGGTLATLAQCLQVVSLAEELRARWGAPVVPLVWNDCEGIDSRRLEERTVLDRSDELARVRLEAVARGERSWRSVPLVRERYGLGAARAFLRQLYGDAPKIDAALDLFMPREGEDLGRACTRSWLELFGPRGLVVVESDTLRERGSQALARIVSGGFLASVREALATFPGGAPLELEEEELIVHTGGTTPRILGAGGDGYRYRDEPGSRTPSELAAELVQEPQPWSPSPLLRPLVRDLVLPVAAVVGDRGELARHLITADLHRSLGLPLPAFLRRVSLTLVDGAARDALEREGLQLEQVLRHGSPEGEVPVPDRELLEALDVLAQESRERLANLRPRLTDLEPSLAIPWKRATRELLGSIERLGQKVARVGANRRGRSRRRRRLLANGLRPHGGPQDEVHGPIPWVARHGTGWIDGLARELDPACAEHLVLHLP